MREGEKERERKSHDSERKNKGKNKAFLRFLATAERSKDRLI